MDITIESLYNLSDKALLELRNKIQDDLNKALRLRQLTYAELSENIKQLKQLSERRRELLRDLREHKSIRFQLINKVKELRKNALRLKKDLSEAYQNLREIKRRIRLIRRNLPNTSLDLLEKRILELEWYHQTHSLSLDEENKILNEISRLAVQLQTANEYKTLIQSLNTIKERITITRNELQKIREDIAQIEDKIKEQDIIISNIKNELNDISNLLTEKRSTIANTKTKLDDIRNKISSLQRDLKLLDKELERRELLKRAQKIAKILQIQREKLREKALEAYEKFKKGERLSLEEYKLLLEFDLISVKSSG